MGQFLGLVNLEQTVYGGQLTKTPSTGAPVDADALPTYRIYGVLGTPLTNGTGSLAFKDTGAITGASNTMPIVITSANHGLTTGTSVTISGVGGNPAANGTFTITMVDGNTFSLNGTTGNGNYSTGGTWHVTGYYGFSYAVHASNGFASGQTYTVLVQWAVSSVQQADLLTFIAT